MQKFKEKFKILLLEEVKVKNLILKITQMLCNILRSTNNVN